MTSPDEQARSIVFKCACTNVMEAPCDWAGRQVRCVVCRAVTIVPETCDPAALRSDEAVTETARRKAVPARAVAPIPLPSPEEVPVRPRSPTAPPLSRSAQWSKTITMVIVPFAVLGAGYLWYRRTKPIPTDDATVAASSLAAENPRREAQEILAAQRAYEQRGHALADAEKLAVLYRRAAKVPADQGQRAYLCNNAAWFYATTTHLSLRDPEQALLFARVAVELTGETEPNYLDTLAEALYVSHRYQEAVATERRALDLLPDAGPDFLQRFEKYRAAVH
jgi:hypothetical protein